jgi:hypothetical protein
MSHHFDTKLAREEPSLNLCDFYLFDGSLGKTVMAMTVNPDAGLSASDSFSQSVKCCLEAGKAASARTAQEKSPGKVSGAEFSLRSLFC